jgi:hypothetical protein
VLLGVALCAFLGGPVAAAQANDNTLRATLNHYGPKIKKDEKAVKKGLAQYPQGVWKPLVLAIRHEVGDLRALTRKLRNESASSTRGARAKALIIKGLGLIANAYGALRHDILAVHGGAVPASKVNAAIKTDKKGIALNKAGLKLLS